MGAELLQGVAILVIAFAQLHHASCHYREAKARLRGLCPHSLVNAKGTCQMCGQRRIQRLQSSARIDGSADGS